MKLIPSKAPRLLAAPVEYAQRFVDDLTNTLRLYFNQIDTIMSLILGTRGGQYINNPYGAFQSQVSHTVATINTPTLIELEVTDYANGMYRVVGDGVHVEQSGLYNLQFSAQITNADTQAHDAAIWFRKNGADFAWTDSVVTVPSTHGGQPGYFVVAANFFIALNAGDYVEMWWSTNSTQVSLNALPAITSPFVAPGAPSVVLTVSFVSSLPT